MNYAPLKFLLKCALLTALLLFSISTYPYSEKLANLHLTQPAVSEKARLPSIDFIPFQNGEELHFDLSYGVISAGSAFFKVDELEESYHISVFGRSYKFFDIFYKVRDLYESYVDKKTLLSRRFHRNIREAGYRTEEQYDFDQRKNTITVGSKIYSVREDMLDIISCFYYVRSMDFSRVQPGWELNMNTFFEKSMFPVGVKYIGRGTIKTSLGNFRCLIFQPKLIPGRVFKNQSDMTLYVSDDKNQIPLRVKSAVYLDYVYADLISYKNLKYPLTSLIPKAKKH